MDDCWDSSGACVVRFGIGVVVIELATVEIHSFITLTPCLNTFCCRYLFSATRIAFPGTTIPRPLSTASPLDDLHPLHQNWEFHFSWRISTSSPSPLTSAIEIVVSGPFYLRWALPQSPGSCLKFVIADGARGWRANVKLSNAVNFNRV